MAAAAGCRGGDGGGVVQAESHMLATGRPDPSIPPSLAARDGLTLEQATAKAQQTLRLAMAARASGHPQPPPARLAHLERAAKARLWLRERFEPSHTADDIPAQDPALLEAAQGYQIARPHPVVIMCQLLLVPSEAAPEGAADDPGWRARALQLMAPIQQAVAPLLPAGARDACPTLRAMTRHLDPDPSPEHHLRYEAAGLALGRCLEEAPGGTCTKPALDPVWEAAVTAHPQPGLVPPFVSAFGAHLVYVHEHLPASPPDDPQVQARLRASVLSDWRRRELDAVLERLRRERTVRVASGLGDTP